MPLIGKRSIPRLQICIKTNLWLCFILIAGFVDSAAQLVQIRLPDVWAYSMHLIHSYKEVFHELHDILLEHPHSSTCTTVFIIWANRENRHNQLETEDKNHWNAEKRFMRSNCLSIRSKLFSASNSREVFDMICLNTISFLTTEDVKN